VNRDVIDRVNASLAVRITRAVGSMWCAYAFAVLALLGLPPALAPGGMGPVAWFAQTFLQLVLLSILAVGQQVQTQAADQHAEQLEAVHERLDEHADRLHAIHAHVTKPTPPRTGRTRKEPAP
jgi:cobalamin biosynthesis protein CobD/CbiB